MATTIRNATLTVTVEEEITLNGSKQGAKNIARIPDINEISKRILNITTTEVVIATFSANVPSTGHYINAATRYIRFTNLDDDNFITLTFRNQDNDEFAVKLEAGKSFMLNGDNSNGMLAIFNATQDADAASDTAFGSLTNIQADANTGSCDLEMFIASV
tara:strand:- start:819 stop:1298 length:480 start_codon:yes stop_codon:yes gene_type:complete